MNWSKREMLKTKWYLPVLAMLLVLLLAGVAACVKKESQGPDPTKVPQVSVVVAKIVALRGPIQDYYYEVDVEILKSQAYEGAKDPTKDKVGKVITLIAREDMSALSIGKGVGCYVTMLEDQGKKYYIGAGFIPTRIEQKQQ